MTQSRRSGIVLGLIVAGIVNLDGLLRYTALPSLEPGGLNPLLGPASLITVLLALIRWRGWDIPQRRPQRPTLFAWLLMLGTVGLLGVSGGAVQPEKLFRDVVYLSLLPLSFFLYLTLERHEKVDTRALARTLAVITLGVGPALAIGLAGFAMDRRFAGLVLSYPLFAGVCLLVTVLVLLEDDGPGWRSTWAAVAIIWIVASGTRSVLVMALALLPFLWLARQPQTEKVSRVRAGLGLTLAAIMVGVVAILASGNLSDRPRALSVNDIDVGSLASRFRWINWTWGKIVASGYFGGFGAGDSEAALGVLPHFDLLRFWNDYSILALLAFLFLLLSMIFRRGARAGTVTGAGLFLLTIGLSGHNFMQSPGATLLTGFVLGAAGSKQGGGDVPPTTAHTDEGAGAAKWKTRP